jgi:hypothetical protein
MRPLSMKRYVFAHRTPHEWPLTMLVDFAGQIPILLQRGPIKSSVNARLFIEQFAKITQQFGSNSKNR